MPRLSSCLLTLAAGLAALAGCAAPPSNPAAVPTSTAERQCLFQNDVESFRVRSSDQTVFVRGIGKAVFELQVSGACRDMDHAMGMAFWPQRGLDRLCTGDTTQIMFSGAHRQKAVRSRDRRPTRPRPPLSQRAAGLLRGNPVVRGLRTAR